MSTSAALLWGLFGGASVEIMELVTVLKRTGGVLPRRWTRPYFLLAEVLRVAVGGGLAVALTHSDQLSGTVGALAVGAAAPLILEKFANATSEVS